MSIKNQWVFMCLSVCFSPLTSFAVSMDKCPATLTVSYGATALASDKKLQEDTNTIFSFEEMKENRRVFSTLKLENVKKMRLKLKRQEKSQCGYYLEKVKVDGDKSNETRLFTRDGRDILRVAFTVGKEIFWVYHNVESYSLEGIEVSESKYEKVLGLFDHGAPRVNIGYVSEITVK